MENAEQKNFNQCYNALVCNFGEQKAFEMIQIIAESTREFGFLQRKIEEKVIKLREQIRN